ncbi:MAG TPA: FtsK/SpoIIIE domain-containing protein [Acidimicrobiales bacterium]|nr:FtsK/SpoIIIE domain-containing protein [Acidimicrobiales bacterium]
MADDVALQPVRTAADDHEVTVAAVLPGGRRLPLTVRAAGDHAVGEVAAALAAAAGMSGRPTLYAGLTPLDPGTPLAGAGLREGALVGLGQPVVDVAPPAGGLEVAVVGGLHAGEAVPARPGSTVTVGRASDAGLHVDDPEVSRRHAVVRVDADGAAVLEDAGSRNGTSWQGYRLERPAPIDPGDVAQAGESVVTVRPAAPAEPVLEAGATPGTVRYNRPPRITPPAAQRELVLPEEPEDPRGIRFPAAAVVLPLVIGGLLFAFMGPTPYLLFILLSPLMMAANVVGDRRAGRRDHRRKKAAFDAAMATLDADLSAAVAADERATRAEFPDPAAVLAIASGPTGRLWERRVTDPDFLHLRVGLADRPAAVRIRATGRAADEERAVAPPARLVPVTVDLQQAGVVGVAGPRPSVLAHARAVVVAAATLHSPRDLRVVVLTGAEQAGDWAWAAWLPHALPADEGGSRRSTAADLAQAEARLAELSELLGRRSARRRTLLADGPPPGHRVLVVVDGSRRIRTLAGVTELLQDGPDCGIYTLCIERDEPSLPSEARATVVFEEAPSRVTVRRPGAAPATGVLADGMAEPLADRAARALAPVRELGGDRGGVGSLPARARLLDVLGVPDLDAGEVRRRWAASPGGRTTRVVLGVAGDGPFTVDLAADGPHALVAGTTGSGKSELLQTLVASLALGNRPDQLNVVLVDYKGGAAFAGCARLPHCAGLVTDLDGHLAERALASLTAELRRRERLLASVGATDIDGYWASGAAEPLARLVVIVDEFATMVEEVPDFVTGVVGIGMRGRSLGVHVVLATQRPAGVVTGDLRANVNLRVSLRVADDAESTDVIDAPDAARLPANRPGRAYARTGHDTLTAFQAARVGGPRPGSGAAGRTTVEVEPFTVAALGSPLPEAPAEAPGAATDLSVVVAAVREAAAAEAVEPQAGPWLAPLPDRVTLHELGPGRPAGPLDVVLGLADHPGEQAQAPFSVDLEHAGALLVAGGVRSGRSGVLRTLAAGVAAGASPVDVHLYVVDAGNRALAGLGELPHCGAWVAADDTDRVERLVAWLSAEVAERQRALSAGGFGSLAEQRAGDAPLPYVVVLLDKLEAFAAVYAERDGGRVVDALDRLLREGPSVGVVFVLSADRTGVSSRLLSAVGHRLVLRQAERDDYQWFDIPPRSVPAVVPPGRAFWSAGPVEVQVALLAEDPSGQAQGAAVAELATVLRRRWSALPPASRPRRVDPLPTDVSLAAVEAVRAHPRPEGDAVVTLAAGGDELGPVDVDLEEIGPAFVVAGPPRSGRSTALAAVVSTIDRPVVVIAPRPSPLRDLDGLLALYTSADDAADRLGDLLDEVDGPVAVVVDDAELVVEGRLAQLLEQVVRAARDHDIVVVAAATTDDLIAGRFRGWLADVRRCKAGLLLCPSSNLDGDALDVKLPRSLAGGWPAGRALLVTRNRAAPVQVLRVP